jgi:SNF2 family DNA or RNA helicase
MANLQHKTFLSKRYKKNEHVVLDETYEIEETPKGFKGTLYPHQKTVLAALLEIERKRFVRIDGSINKYSEFGDDCLVETTAGILAESFGSGKTIEILALIMASKHPVAFPEYTPAHISMFSDYYTPKNSITNGFTPYVSKVYNNIIKPNVIVVGSSVLHQWKDAIKEFTGLKTFVIENVMDFRIFCNIIKKFKENRSNKINDYGVILVKSGTVTSNLQIPELEERIKKTSGVLNLVNCVAIVLRGICVTRLIIDDYDTIKLFSNCMAIVAMFTWFVSATKKFAKKNADRSIIDDAGEYERFASSSQKYVNDVYNDFNLSHFSVKCHDQYFKKSFEIPKMRKYTYSFKNINDKYINLLGSMADDELTTVVEMLNADATQTAAEFVGIGTSSTADIYKKILGDKFEKFYEHSDIARVAEGARVYTEPLSKYEFQPGDISEIRKQIKLCSVLYDEYIPGKSSYLMRSLDDLVVTNSEKRDHLGKMIERVKSNIGDDGCPVCCLPFDDETNEMIMKCCGAVLCDKCAVEGSKFRNNLSGTCPNCKKSINFKEDMIFVDSSKVDITGLADYDIIIPAGTDQTNAQDEASKDEASKDDPKDEVVEIPLPKNPKIAAIIKIIHGDKIERSEGGLLSAEVVDGTDFKDIADESKKVLIFAGFTETVGKVTEVLDTFKISYSKLEGTARQMHSAVTDFKEKNTVLLVNSSKHCAGLNLQIATDVIYVHKIFDSNIEGQISGRAQRIGRTSSLRVHFLTYENEGRVYF